ncbi:MAG: insulinase family protein [Candidatus Zixiibacteriota bacterium]|nr:MAG: insulinase family protein [candidate division Zixibacteria bacterium]
MSAMSLKKGMRCWLSVLALTSRARSSCRAKRPLVNRLPAPKTARMIQSTTLDNGIRVITEQIPAVHSVALGVWVTAGSRHEPNPQSGISHFIEHMLFKGTTRRSALAIARELDNVGGCLTAFSSTENCCYYVKLLSEEVPLAIDLLADVLQFSLFDLDELEKERRVILSEISQREETSDEQVNKQFNKLLLRGHPLSRSVCGSATTLGGLDRAALLTYYRRYYCGANFVLTAAGCLDHRLIVDQVQSAFSGLAAGTVLEPDQAPQYQRGVARVEKQLDQVHFCLGTKGVAQSSADRFAFHLLNNLLGGGMSSRLFQSIREEHGLAYSVYSYARCYSDAGSLVVYAATAPDDAVPAIRLVLEALRALRTDPVPKEILRSARNQLKASLLLNLEGTENRMTRLAQNELYLRRIVPVDEVLTAIDQVTADDLQRLANSLLTDDTLCLQLLGPVSQVDFSALDLTVGS